MRYPTPATVAMIHAEGGQAMGHAADITLHDLHVRANVDNATGVAAVLAELGDRSVRPVRPGKHRARAARRRYPRGVARARHDC